MIAQELQVKYGLPQMQLWLLNQQTPMAGAVLPEEYASTGLLSVENRSSYLASDNATLYIAHPLIWFHGKRHFTISFQTVATLR